MSENSQVSRKVGVSFGIFALSLIGASYTIVQRGHQCSLSAQPSRSRRYRDGFDRYVYRRSCSSWASTLAQESSSPRDSCTSFRMRSTRSSPSGRDSSCECRVCTFRGRAERRPSPDVAYYRFSAYFLSNVRTVRLNSNCRLCAEIQPPVCARTLD